MKMMKTISVLLPVLFASVSLAATNPAPEGSEGASSDGANVQLVGIASCPVCSSYVDMNLSNLSGTVAETGAKPSGAAAAPASGTETSQ